MLKDLDETLKLLLSNNLKSDVIDQGGYRISFEPPSQEIENKGTIINLFLYDIRENTELRSSVRRGWEKSIKKEGVSKRVFASTRVDCSLLGRQEGLKVLCGKDYSKKKKDKIPYKTVHCPSKRT